MSISPELSEFPDVDFNHYKYNDDAAVSGSPAAIPAAGSQSVAVTSSQYRAQDEVIIVIIVIIIRDVNPIPTSILAVFNRGETAQK